MARKPKAAPRKKKPPKYKIYLTNPAKRDMRKVQRRDAGGVRDAIDDLAKAPRGGDSKKISNDPHGRWRKRVGNTRIVYTIDDKGRVVVVSIIKDRSGVYKLLPVRSPI